MITKFKFLNGYHGVRVLNTRVPSTKCETHFKKVMLNSKPYNNSKICQTLVTFQEFGTI
jgi:hypothetical protein